MTEWKYTDIVNKAKNIKKNVEKEYRLGESVKWIYPISKAILTHKNVTKIKLENPSKPAGDSISRQIVKSDYLDMCKRLCKYVEAHNQIPNYISYGKIKVNVKVTLYAFSRILIYYHSNKANAKYVNVNSKCFNKPTEYPNKVYGLWVKYIKTKPKYIDDVCDYIKAHFTYQFYFDDQKSNEQVLKTKAGNCTDLLQMLCNMANAMDYDYKVIHTKCRQSGTGHVYGKFRKKGTNNWFIRDIACIADESRYCVWCNVDTGAGYLQATNPAWFMANLNR